MIIKWFNKRIKKFGIAPLDLLDPCPGVVSGVPFAALVESQREGTFDIQGMDGVSRLQLVQRSLSCCVYW